MLWFGASLLGRSVVAWSGDHATTERDGRAGAISQSAEKRLNSGDERRRALRYSEWRYGSRADNKFDDKSFARVLTNGSASVSLASRRLARLNRQPLAVIGLRRRNPITCSALCHYRIDYGCKPAPSAESPTRSGRVQGVASTIPTRARTCSRYGYCVVWCNAKMLQLYRRSCECLYRSAINRSRQFRSCRCSKDSRWQTL
jgi:hypothetical protein